MSEDVGLSVAGPGLRWLVLYTDPSYVPTAAAAVQEVWDLQG